MIPGCRISIRPSVGHRPLPSAPSQKAYRANMLPSDSSTFAMGGTLGRAQKSRAANASATSACRITNVAAANVVIKFRLHAAHHATPAFLAATKANVRQARSAAKGIAYRCRARGRRDSPVTFCSLRATLTVAAPQHAWLPVRLHQGAQR